MRRNTTLVAAFLVMAATLSTAHAAVIVNDNFEGYTSQANFEATWIPIGTVAPLSAEWSTEQSSSATHSVKTPGTTVNAQSRNRRTFAESGTLGVGDQLVWSFDFHDATGTGNPQRNYANLQDTTAPSGTPQLVSMGLSNNLLATAEGGNYYMARILGGSSNGGAASAYFKLNDAGAPLRSAGWHNLKAVLSNDGVGGAGATDFRFYVDNILSETVLNVGATLRSYDNIAIGSALGNSNVGAFFDNMYLEFVPANTAPTVVDVVVGPPYNANEPGEPQTLTHQFTATDVQTPAGPFTWDALTLLSYTPNYGGVAPGPAVAATLSGTGLFSWVSEGSPRGDYVWQVRGTDPGGLSDLGTITVHVTEVPEPATFALCGLALAGIALGRRRLG